MIVDNERSNYHNWHDEMRKGIRRFLRRINHVTNTQRDYQKIFEFLFQQFHFCSRGWKWIIDYSIPFFSFRTFENETYENLFTLFDNRSIYHPAEKITSVRKNTRRLLKHRGKVVKNSAKIVLVCQCCPRSLLIEGFMTRMLSWKLSLEIGGRLFKL